MLNRKKKAQHNSFHDSNPELDLNLHSLGTQIVCQEIFVKITLKNASNLFCLQATAVVVIPATAVQLHIPSKQCFLMTTFDMLHVLDKWII